MAIETQGFWLSLWGRTLDSSAIVELQTGQPRTFLPPGTFCKPVKAKVGHIVTTETYNIWPVTIGLAESYPFIVYYLELSDVPDGPGSIYKQLILPSGGVSCPAKPPTFRFSVGSLIIRAPLANSCRQDEALIATPVSHFTANGWCRRTFHYDDPARVFQPTAIVYRDSLDAIVFVEEFNRQGDTIVTERFSLQ
jgi:hypothetical protein